MQGLPLRIIGGSGKQAHSLAGRFYKNYLGYEHSEAGCRRTYLFRQVMKNFGSVLESR